jgi:hypothetical protein
MTEKGYIYQYRDLSWSGGGVCFYSKDILEVDKVMTKFRLAGQSKKATTKRALAKMGITEKDLWSIYYAKNPPKKQLPTDMYIRSFFTDEQNQQFKSNCESIRLRFPEQKGVRFCALKMMGFEFITVKESNKAWSERMGRMPGLGSTIKTVIDGFDDEQRHLFIEIQKEIRTNPYLDAEEYEYKYEWMCDVEIIVPDSKICGNNYKEIVSGRFNSFGSYVPNSLNGLRNEDVKVYITKTENHSNIKELVGKSLFSEDDLRNLGKIR